LPLPALGDSPSAGLRRSSFHTMFSPWFMAPAVVTGHVGSLKTKGKALLNRSSAF
jgi:hypothetical protein